MRSRGTRFSSVSASQLGRGRETGGEDEAAHALPAELGDDAVPLRRAALGEEGDLRLSQDLNAAGMDVLEEAGQGQPRFLDARAVDDVVQPFAAGEQGEAQRLGGLIAEQLSHDHGGNGGAFVRAHRCSRRGGILGADFEGCQGYQGTVACASRCIDTFPACMP